MMADDKSAIREVVVAVKAADSLSSLFPNEQNTTKIEDQAENETNYLTGMRLKTVAVTYVRPSLIRCLTEYH